MSRLTKGYLIAMTAIVIWSTIGIFVGVLVTNYAMPPVLLAFWRNFLACVALGPVLWLTRRSLLRIDRAQIGFFIVYGLILALMNSIWIISVQANGAAVGTVLIYSSAGITAVLARWLFREHLGFSKIAAIVLSLIGCVLVSNAYNPANWNLNALGIVTGFFSGITFAGYNLMGQTAAQRKINPWTSLLYSFAIASVFTLIFNLLPGIPGNAGSLAAVVPALPTNGWLLLIVLSFIPTVLGFGLYNTAMHYLPASTASLLATSEPAMTAAEAYVFLDERMTLIQVIGSLVILSAVVMVRFGDKLERFLPAEYDPV